MQEPKDLFSAQAAVYAAFRPVYPQALYDFLYGIAPAFGNAWDCGTGNGQVAVQLAKRFDHVFATDISTQQIAHAQPVENISYEVTRGEQTDLAAHSCDLVTVATAVHWFDFDAFYQEVRRVAKSGAILALWAYAPCTSDDVTDKIIDHFHFHTVGAYWDSRREYVDELYRTLPFPFEELETPPFDIKVSWSQQQLEGYLHSWSAVQHYKKATGEDPVLLVSDKLNAAWGADTHKTFTFPLFMRAGIVR